MYDRKTAARPFDTFHDILRSLSLVKSLLKGSNGAHACILVEKRRVKKYRQTGSEESDRKGCLKINIIFWNLLICLERILIGKFDKSYFKLVLMSLSPQKLLENSVGYPAGKNLVGIEKNCHEKACHCVGGEYLFFGNERKFADSQEMAFGESYRFLININYLTLNDIFNKYNIL